MSQKKIKKSTGKEEVAKAVIEEIENYDERSIDINENAIPRDITAPQYIMERKERLKKILEENYAKDHTPVTGIFRWYESPQGVLKFAYGSRYATDGIMHFEFEDEKSYTIPRMVAEHLNKRYRIINKHRVDKHGVRHQEAGTRKQRMAFIPTGFMDAQTLREIESGGAEALINVTR